MSKKSYMNLENISSANDVFKEIINNPQKFKNIIKTVGTKLEHKIKSGDIDEEQIAKDAQNIINKLSGSQKNIFKNMFAQSKKGFRKSKKGFNKNNPDLNIFKQFMKKSFKTESKPNNLNIPSYSNSWIPEHYSLKSSIPKDTNPPKKRKRKKKRKKNKNIKK